MVVLPSPGNLMDLRKKEGVVMGAEGGIASAVPALVLSWMVMCFPKMSP